ncbi:MAG: hypothetical protein AABX35_02365 [Nanoarchaeota archaeon]
MGYESIKEDEERREFTPSEKERIDIVLKGKKKHYIWELDDLVLAIRQLNNKIDLIEKRFINLEKGLRNLGSQNWNDEGGINNE